MVLKGGRLLSTKADNVVQVFDKQFSNSITYSTGIRSPGSVYEFDYWGTEIKLIGDNTRSTVHPLTIYIDGVFDREVSISDNSEHILIFSAGKKRIKIIEADCSMPSDVIEGCRIKSIILDEFRYRKVNEGNLVERLVFLGDSITNGASATNKIREGYPWLFRFNDSKDVTVHGWGWGTLKQMAETTELVNQTVSYLTTLFTNVTTKKVVITLGTNDWGVNYTGSTAFSTWYASLLDAINVADSGIEIFCISPLLRSNDASSLDDYRTEISGLCSTRAYATYVEGKTILGLPDLADGLHPSTSGHLKVYNSIKSIILT